MNVLQIGNWAWRQWRHRHAIPARFAIYAILKVWRHVESPTALFYAKFHHDPIWNGALGCLKNVPQHEQQEEHK